MNISIKQRVASIAGAFMLAIAAVVVPVVPVSVSAQSTQASCESMNGTWKNKKCTLDMQGGIDSAKGADVPSTLFGANSIFTTVVNVLLFIIGALSVIMLIWGGIRYTTSAGNSAAVTSAKNTIMYAIIGLVVAFLAFAVVNWVLGALS